MVLTLQVFEQKIFALQEELTNLHRHKSDDAQQIVDLTRKLQETEKVFAAKLLEAEKKLAAKDTLYDFVQ